MMIFLAGLVVFFGVHLFVTFRARTPEKDVRQKWGEAKYKGLVSGLALAGLILLIWGFGQARPSSALYSPPSWGAHLNMLLMLLALIALMASQLPAGHIKVRLKHPMLVSIKIWALGHLISNGEIISVLLFGSFLAYAVIDRIAVKRRGDVGAAMAVPDSKWDIIAILAGLLIYVAFVVILHEWLIGVPVMAV